MRIFITNDKSYLIDLLVNYMDKLLKNKEVDLIINGNKKNIIITSVTLENDEHTFIVLSNDKGHDKIPILDETKVRLGKELVALETQSHTTIIEIDN